MWACYSMERYSWAFSGENCLFLHFIQISLHLDPTYVAVNKRMNDGSKKADVYSRINIALYVVVILKNTGQKEKKKKKRKLSLQENWTGRRQSGFLAALWNSSSVSRVYSGSPRFSLSSPSDNARVSRRGDAWNRRKDCTDSVLALPSRKTKICKQSFVHKCLQVTWKHYLFSVQMKVPLAFYLNLFGIMDT